jgi:hypothetical protein
MSQQLFLTFPNRETAQQVASALVGYDVENFQLDGWWENPETGQLVYWNLDDIGVLTKVTGEGDDAVIEFLPGYHINGIWGSDDPVPPALATFRVFPETPSRVWG